MRPESRKWLRKVQNFCNRSSVCVCGGGGGGGAEWREEGEVVPRSISSQFKVWDPLGPHYFKPPHAYV